MYYYNLGGHRGVNHGVSVLHYCECTWLIEFHRRVDQSKQQWDWPNLYSEIILDGEYSGERNIQKDAAKATVDSQSCPIRPNTAALSRTVKNSARIVRSLQTVNNTNSPYSEHIRRVHLLLHQGHTVCYGSYDSYGL